MELDVRGPSLPEAFTRIGLMLFAAVVDPVAVRDVEVREVRAHGGGLPALLRQWLEECLYVHEVEGFACRSIDFAVFEATPRAGGEPVRLHALLRGEPLDPERHQARVAVRGISREGVVVEPDGGGWRARARLQIDVV
ncbi:MAG TPA: archease [Methylomirabilota bacterium]|nr:archease [Methylomirabilota bacterium]